MNYSIALDHMWRAVVELKDALNAQECNGTCLSDFEVATLRIRKKALDFVTASDAALLHPDNCTQRLITITDKMDKSTAGNKTAIRNKFVKMHRIKDKMAEAA